VGPVLLGSAAMASVGGSAAVSGTLGDAPLCTAQSLRYALACLLLLGVTRVSGRRVDRPRGTEWLWLAGVTGAGLVLFNVALVAGAAHAEPALLAVAVACTPLLLAVVGPLLEGGRPTARTAVAAGVVTAGAALVQGTGRGDGSGLLWAVVVLACEAAFTLLAVPVLGRHGPFGVSVHATWMAAVAFGAGAPLFDSGRLDQGDLVAVAYLAVAVTAVAFVLWYGAVRRLGAGRAGLLTGVAPVAAAITGVALGLPMPSPTVWLGIAGVVTGLVVGLRNGPLPAASGAPSSPAPERVPPVKGRSPRSEDGVPHAQVDHCSGRRGALGRRRPRRRHRGGGSAARQDGRDRRLDHAGLRRLLLVRQPSGQLVEYRWGER
jgi:drug/metabolite transporter (DMT)-like permease